MNDCLFGYTGFVGSTLLRQRSFDRCFRSTDIAESAGLAFNLVVCAAAPAQKWLANLDPEKDEENIRTLCEHLARIRCKTFVLISTVDVFKDPVEVNETSAVELDGLHAYGLHRHMLENFVRTHFANHLIVRLPGLVGSGLKKNVIFDFLNNNKLDMIESRAVYQFYPMINLWFDLEKALRAGLKLVHLTAAPVSVSEIALDGFGRSFSNELVGAPAKYDFRSLYAQMFGGDEFYQYSKRETIASVRAYAQTELAQLKRPNVMAR